MEMRALPDVGGVVETEKAGVGREDAVLLLSKSQRNSEESHLQQQ